MKRYLFRLKFFCGGLVIILLCINFLSATGQVPELQNSDNYRLLKLHYTNSSGEEGITEFEYDVFGNMKFSKWELFNGERSSVNLYVLNKKTQIIEKHRIFSDSITTKQVFSYNLCGKLIRQTYSRSDGVNGTANYYYDEHGNLSSSVCNNYNGWFNGKIVYNYNAFDVIDKSILLNENKNIGKISYQYDIDGNLKMEKWDFNGLWHQTFMYEYIDAPEKIYESSNPFIVNHGFYRVEEEYYEYSGGGEGPSTYKYENGKLIKKVFYRSDGLKTETAYRYDEKGMLLSSSREYSDGKTAEFYYSFNANNRMTKRWFKRSDGLEGEEIYTYDQEGRLVMAVYKKMDAWLSGTIAFSHDQDGLPIKAYFKGDENFDADIYFYYDGYKNLTKIKWDFSFGKSQVYTFKYSALYKVDKYTSDTLQ